MHEFHKLLDYPYMLFDAIYDSIKEKDFDINYNDIVLNTDLFALKIVDNKIILKMISWYETQDEFEKCHHLKQILIRLETK
jgi:hypothetical protein